MTELRPEPDAGRDGPYERGAYEAGASETASAFEAAGFEETGAFEAAVGRLTDPLNDPLPGQHTSPWFRAEAVSPPAEAVSPDEPGPGHEQGRGRRRGQHRAPDPHARAQTYVPVPEQAQTSQLPHPAQPSPPSQLPESSPSAQSPRPPRMARVSQETPSEWYDPEGFERDWYGARNPAPAPEARPVPPRPSSLLSVASAVADDEAAGARAAEPGGADDPLASTRQMPPLSVPVPVPDPVPVPVPVPGPDPESVSVSVSETTSVLAPVSDPEPEEPRTGGRAERRRAAKGRGRRRAEPRQGPANPAPPTPDRPMSRVEARRAARAAKDSPAVVASRVVGELFITLGVLMLLFVTYQLWWTNVRADQYAGKETHKIQDNWAKGDRTPGAFEAGQGFAILHIPKLDVVAPIAEGISKEKVLDRGMVGHYAEGALRTAMPSDKQGNFAIAGHRNTHGEPFRYINQLGPGDPIVVETQDTYYTYEMTKMLPQTSPSNISVIGPVPPESGFTKPGQYITLTTCTPEFTSTYRLIVWGKMVDERPRSKGKPDALLD
ncbi:class E sortase [Streptomyces sp. MMS24-I29]|uniref:class E sortase n=1 Tax=Streptomyces sp. MMS24-I29 TaxID=3351480 RepID=UPI003C7E3C4B